MSKKIVIVGTLDTKAEEIKYIKHKIEDRDHQAIVIDVGVLGEVPFKPSVNRQQVAQASGVTLEEITAYGSEAKAEEKMAEGAAKVIKELHANGDLDGVLAIGGTMGTDLALDVMAALPLGVPKLIVSSVAFSQLIPPDRICADLMMVLWAGGLWGVNSICRGVLDTAAGAISGAAEAYNKEAVVSQRPVIGVTAAGSSALNYLFWLKPALEDRGYEVAVFHSVGMGGRAFENLISKGTFSAVLDLCMMEVLGHMLDCPCSSGEDRLEAASKMGIPQIVGPGLISCVAISPWKPVPRRFKNRHIRLHNRLISDPPCTSEEKAMLGEVVAKKLNKATGPTAIVIPLQGSVDWDRPGQPLYDPEGLTQFSQALGKNIKPEIKVVELDAHINDKTYADEVLKLFDEMMSR